MLRAGDDTNRQGRYNLLALTCTCTRFHKQEEETPFCLLQIKLAYQQKMVALRFSHQRTAKDQLVSTKGETHTHTHPSTPKAREILGWHVYSRKARNTV